jgi:hypothetical protein
VPSIEIQKASGHGTNRHTVQAPILEVEEENDEDAQNTTLGTVDPKQTTA